jgi:hypothetical protein
MRKEHAYGAKFLSNKPFCDYFGPSGYFRKCSICGGIEKVAEPKKRKVNEAQS